MIVPSWVYHQVCFERSLEGVLLPNSCLTELNFITPQNHKVSLYHFIVIIIIIISIYKNQEEQSDKNM